MLSFFSGSDNKIHQNNLQQEATICSIWERSLFFSLLNPNPHLNTGLFFIYKLICSSIHHKNRHNFFFSMTHKQHNHQPTSYYQVCALFLVRCIKSMTLIIDLGRLRFADIKGRDPTWHSHFTSQSFCPYIFLPQNLLF